MQDAEPIFPTEPSAEPALPVTIAAPPQEEDDDFPRAVAAQALGDPKNLQQLQDVLGLYLGVPIRLAEAGFQVLVYFELAGAPPKIPDPLARFFDGWDEEHAIPSMIHIDMGALRYLASPGAPRILGSMAALERARKDRRAAPERAAADGRRIIAHTLEILREQVAQARANMIALVN